MILPWVLLIFQKTSASSSILCCYTASSLLYFFPFGLIFKWAISAFGSSRHPIAQGLIGRKVLSFQNCLLSLLPVFWEEQSYACTKWCYSRRSFPSSNQMVTYLSKVCIKPVLLHLMMRWTLFNRVYSWFPFAQLWLSFFYAVYFPSLGWIENKLLWNGCSQKEPPWPPPSRRHHTSSSASLCQDLHSSHLPPSPN